MSVRLTPRPAAPIAGRLRDRGACSACSTWNNEECHLKGTVVAAGVAPACGRPRSARPGPPLRRCVPRAADPRCRESHGVEAGMSVRLTHGRSRQLPAGCGIEARVPRVPRGTTRSVILRVRSSPPGPRRHDTCLPKRTRDAIGATSRAGRSRKDGASAVPRVPHGTLRSVVYGGTGCRRGRAGMIHACSPDARGVASVQPPAAWRRRPRR